MSITSRTYLMIFLIALAIAAILVLSIVVLPHLYNVAHPFLSDVMDHSH